jgi:hypothetical protein
MKIIRVDMITGTISYEDTEPALIEMGAGADIFFYLQRGRYLG